MSRTTRELLTVLVVGPIAFALGWCVMDVVMLVVSR